VLAPRSGPVLNQRLRLDHQLPHKLRYVRVMRHTVTYTS
jgi:hypothetical protein